MKRVSGIEWITLRGMCYDHFQMLSLPYTFHIDLNDERRSIISIIRRDIILKQII